MRDMATSGPVRAAIYVRKSDEKGLEQNFNSLDAQRAACEAYIESQRHAGWVLVPEEFADGGISGGTMERPGLQKLLAEIRAGRIDQVVVLKIDRLSRSIADFARIMELFDTHGASFTSVTQNFSTGTAMGKLTLHILMSFAEFERELTGERIREKIAASKARGLWMGGVVPLGYDVDSRTLVVNAAEADTVREIFARYLDLGSVPALEAELAARGIMSKLRISKTGKRSGGKPITRGALYTLLQNRIYLGKICHKGEAFEGAHAAIVDHALFDRVQQRLERNRVDRAHCANVADPSLLVGKVGDGLGRPMSPSHANKGARRYRYYVSRKQGPEDSEPQWRVPAGDLEELVIGRLCAFLVSEAAVLDAIDAYKPDAVAIDGALLTARRLGKALELATPVERRRLLADMLQKVTVEKDAVRIGIARGSLLSDHGGQPADDACVTLTVLARLARVGNAVKLVVPPGDNKDTPRRDPALIKLVVKAYAARAAVEADPGTSIAEHARRQGHAREYFGLLLRLGYLAPDITAAILDGRQPAGLNRQALARLKGLPHEWPSQRRKIGFS